jgi:hypothetical protein
MNGDSESYRSPYTPYPGGATPAAREGPTEGWHELSTFFWLALLNSTIIAVAGVLTWWYIHP